MAQWIHGIRGAGVLAAAVFTLTSCGAPEPPDSPAASEQEPLAGSPDPASARTTETASTVPTGSALGTAADRKALVDYLIERTMEREAFSPVKNSRLNLDVEAAMRAEEAAIVNAADQGELFYALARLSNARRDRHLSVNSIPGGLPAPRYWPGSGETPPVAAIRIDIDYSRTDEVVLFISDVATDPELTRSVMPGDRVLAINGGSAAERLEQARPYIRYSTEHGFRRKVTEELAARTGLLPPSLYRPTLDLSLERADGEVYQVSLEYVDPGRLEWASASRPRYAGYERVIDTQTYDFYVSTSGSGVVILDWHRFNSTIVEDIDALMAYAVEHQLLDHDVIFDATRSGGGSLGAYAIQRLSPRPFKTTFGNLRMSDVIPRFIAEQVANYEASVDPTDGGGKETIDDGTWLFEWLTSDVQAAYDSGAPYSNNVPFKLAHAPKAADGMIDPAEVHFRGDMVCIMGPNGGSHLDQFFAIVSENGLCRTIGMLTGGYSNTWEWEEDVTYPTTGAPVIHFMWNIGHTVSPGGEILEGNPSELDEHILFTRENFADYDQLLLNRALEILSAE